MSSLDRLVLVSRIILDQRILDLRKEVETLKLSLFWKDHEEEKLIDLMREVNNYGANPPRCKCMACGLAGRLEEPGPTSNGPCKFGLWFEQILNSCGMFYLFEIRSGAKIVGQYTSARRSHPLYDVDAHFHLLVERNWFSWSYGNKIRNATSVNDPELLKLGRLFEILKAEVDFESD